MGDGTRLISLQSVLTRPPTALTRHGDRRKRSRDRLRHDLSSHVCKQHGAARRPGSEAPSITQPDAVGLSSTGY